METLLQALDALPVAEADLAAAARLTGDAVGCVLGATGLPAAAPALAWLRAQPAPAAAPAWAFVLGALSNVLELDAMHVASSVHPGTVVVPAALGVALARDMPVPALMRATLRGSEAALRLGRSTGVRHRQQFQSTATCAAVGAALACAELLGLSRAQQLDAMGNAASTAGGLWAFVDEDTLTKQWHAGHASQVGVQCAELAAHGLTGPRHVLDSRRGFHAVLCPDAQPEELAREHGGWQLHGTAFKLWPCPRPVHAALTAALQWAGRRPAAEIEGVSLRTFGMAVDLCSRAQPRTPHEARFSLQHGVAAALVDGRVDFDTYEPAAIGRLAGLTDRVQVHADAAMTAAYPQRSQAALDVQLKDGTAWRAETDHALGDPELPLGGEAVMAKRQALAARCPAADKALLLSAMDAAGRADAGLLPLLRRALAAAGLGAAAA